MLPYDYLSLGAVKELRACWILEPFSGRYVVLQFSCRGSGRRLFERPAGKREAEAGAET
jgi:hypothetical protein